MWLSRVWQIPVACKLTCCTWRGRRGDCKPCCCQWDLCESCRSGCFIKTGEQHRRFLLVEKVVFGLLLTGSWSPSTVNPRTERKLQALLPWNLAVKNLSLLNLIDRRFAQSPSPWMNLPFPSIFYRLFPSHICEINPMDSGNAVCGVSGYLCLSGNEILLAHNLAVSLAWVLAHITHTQIHPCVRENALNF